MIFRLAKRIVDLVLGQSQRLRQGHRERSAYVHEELVAVGQCDDGNHAAGCQAWLIVERDTRTHAIAAVRSCKADT